MEKEYLESLVEQGLSIREISIIIQKSNGSVRHWLNKYGLKTKNKSIGKGYCRYEKIDKDNQTCICCEVKLNSENATYKKSRGTYHSYCKICFAEKSFKQRFNFKIKALEYKGNCCESCSYNKDITALEFHHKNPAQKEINPAKLYHKPWEFAQQELDKCSVLCSNCHREEHHRLDQKKKLEKEFSTNFTSSFSNFILTGKNTGEKSCRNCDIILTEDNRAAGTHNIYCKPCDSKMVMQKTIDAKQRVVDYMGGCCSVCGYDKCLRAIEFHHLDPDKKSETYNKRFTSWGFERQKKELENCIIVCSNCHREIHSKDEHKTQTQTHP
jgi:hypothetical protein